MKKFLVFCCSFLLIDNVSCEQSKVLRRGGCCENRIVGGNSTDISKVPYQAALLWDNYFFCGAAIISPTFLITGAHCILFYFAAYKSEGMVIRLGSNYTHKEGIVVKANNTICHPKFDYDTYDYDICLIELSEPIQFSKNIQPIEIAVVDPKEGEKGTIAGWGTLWAGGSSPENLHSVTVPVANITACKEAYEKISPITDRMFCAGEEGKDSCQGDSGGGLAIEGYLSGIISTGFGCGVKNYPGVYTSLTHTDIRKFIKEHAGI